MSVPLRSNGSFPQPRQKVGQPLSRFCKSINQRIPSSLAPRIRFFQWTESFSPQIVSLCSKMFRRASKAPGVSSASGTAPLKSDHPHPPNAAPVKGCFCVVSSERCSQLAFLCLCLDSLYSVLVFHSTFTFRLLCTTTFE